MYVPLDGFVTKLTDNITYKTRYLPVAPDVYDELLHHLADGDHTFMQLKDGKAIEVVKLHNVCDRLVMDRAAELTRPTSFPCGATVMFVLTEQGVKDAVCQMEEC